RLPARHPRGPGRGRAGPGVRPRPGRRGGRPGGRDPAVPRPAPVLPPRRDDRLLRRGRPRGRRPGRRAPPRRPGPPGVRRRAGRARFLGLRLPDTPVSLPITTANGTVTATVYDGELRVRFPALPGSVFRFYCVFVEEMNPHALPVFGLNDFLDVFRVSFDGRS